MYSLTCVHYGIKRDFRRFGAWQLSQNLSVSQLSELGFAQLFKYLSLASTSALGLWLELRLELGLDLKLELWSELYLGLG